jgi:UDP-N-acetylglucosamine transferase subunit ALG13
MILVSIGNATQGFSRLLNAVDKLAGDGIFGDESVVIQSGNSHEFRAVHCKQVDFLPMVQFAEMVLDANLVICHAGAGTLHHAFQAGKLPIVMPRRKKYGEHIEDQLELVKTLAADGRIIPAYEPENLPAAIAEARQRNKQPIPPPPSRMLELVARAIEDLTHQKR